MNNKLTVISLLSVFAINKIQAQVGIGTTTPDSSAILHLNDPKKGLLLTSIALTSSTDAVTIPSPATGLLIWNNGTGGFTPAGLYYWNNSQWNIISGNSGNNNNVNASGWSNSGNNTGNYSGANTNLSLGTSTYDDLIFKVSSVKAGKLGTNNSVSLGQMASAAQGGIAIGYNAQSTSNESTAIGTNSASLGFQSIALGYNAKTNSNSETALGYNSQTNGQNSTALGSGSSASAQFSTAIGYGAYSNQPNAIILGNSVANVGIGTSSPNTSAKIDINGQYKLGEKGNVHKNQISFEVWTNGATVAPGATTAFNIAIPSANQPSSTKATVTVTPSDTSDGNMTLAISNARLSSTSNVVINLTNVTGSSASLNNGHFYITINEF